MFTEMGTGDVIVAAYPIDPATGRADADGELEVVRVPVDAPFHHGGQARFGPDGLLYVAIGNGASPVELPEPQPWYAQALDSGRGKVLRVDPECAARPLTDPLVAYGHPSFDPTGGSAVVGGAFVTDPDLPELHGAYVFGDFTARAWAIPAGSDGARVRLVDEERSLTAVDVAPDGALLLVGLGGEIVRLVHAPPSP